MHAYRNIFSVETLSSQSSLQDWQTLIYMFPLYTEVYTEDNKTQKLFKERPVDAAAINSKFYGASAKFINRSKQQFILPPFIRCIEYTAFGCKMIHMKSQTAAPLL